MRGSPSPPRRRLQVDETLGYLQIHSHWSIIDSREGWAASPETRGGAAMFDSEVLLSICPLSFLQAVIWVAGKARESQGKLETWFSRQVDACRRNSARGGRGRKSRGGTCITIQPTHTRTAPVEISGKREEQSPCTGLLRLPVKFQRAVSYRRVRGIHSTRAIPSSQRGSHQSRTTTDSGQRKGGLWPVRARKPK